jgi:2-methylisocitrate lyase-like PEP mutase family enzyme
LTPLTKTFRDLHSTGCFIIPNPWDAVSARILAATGFSALASTSSGYAFTTSRKDGHRQIARSEAIEHTAMLLRVSGLPVTMDAEDCYSETPEGVAETVRLAAEAGLSGISVEDRDTSRPGRIREFSEALERIQAAVEAAGPSGIVVTARADGFGKKSYDLGETIARLAAFAQAGADVVYAPGLSDIDMIREVCNAVPVPVNHVLGQGASGLTLEMLALAGVRRVSLGGSFTRAALSQVRILAEELLGGDFQRIDDASTWEGLVT